MKPMAESFPPPPFGGFGEDALAFFRELAEHQDRDWMAANKARYETSVRAPLVSLVAEVSDRLADAGSPLGGDPNRSLFRLHRDVRFSADKRPYKTHAGAVFSRDGVKASPGVLYFHLAPEGAFAAAGFFRPEPPTLDAMRAGVVAAPERWRTIEAALAADGLELAHDDALKRAPRGYEAAPADLGAVLKRKSWIVRVDAPPGAIRTPELVEVLVRLAAQASPLLQFAWAAIARADRRSAS